MEKIYINARFLTQKVTGVQRFAIEVSRKLKSSELGPNLCFIAPHNILHTELAQELEVTVVGTRRGHLWEQLDLVSYLKLQGNPLLLNLANAAPLRYSNLIVTIHDLAVYYNPRWFSFPYLAYYRFMTPLLVRKAKLIFTVSNFVKEELIKRFDINPASIQVIYNAVSENFLLPLKGQSLKQNVILTVSSVEPRKNIRNLILAFNKADIQDHYLYIIGGKSRAFADTDLNKLVENNDRIKLLGRVPDEELLSLYSRAKLFAYLSFYEGFGIPNIEAMAMGTPVITSDIPVFHEVCGEGAFYVDPTNVELISEGLLALINDSKRLNDLLLKGAKQNSKYNWRVSADNIIRGIMKIQE